MIVNSTSSFHPSVIEDQIYSIMEEYETEGIDIFNHRAVTAIEEYFAKHPTVIAYSVNTSDYPDQTGGACGVSWIEGTHLHHIMFDYKYSWED